MVALALSLESRIAAMLSVTEAKSDAVAALITEVEAAAQAADEDASKVREHALDPAVEVDTTKVAISVATAMLTRDRLQAALPRLQERHKQLQANEYEAQWYAELEKTEAKRDALVEELRDYSAMVAKLVDILARIPAIDAEVSRINGSAPPGVHDRLLGVEQKARGVDGFGASGAWEPRGLLSLATDLKLPKFEADGNSYQYSWPPPKPSLAAQMATSMTIPYHPGVNWHEAQDERDRRKREESARLSAFYEAREREAEKRREAELREASEADRRRRCG